MGVALLAANSVRTATGSNRSSFSTISKGKEYHQASSSSLFESFARHGRLVNILNPQLQQPLNSNKIDDNEKDVEELFFAQTLDHFRPSNRRNGNTFQQRYFVSRRFNVAQDEAAQGPHRVRHVVFLCVGGEGPSLTKRVLIDSVHCSGDMLYTAQKLYSEYNNDENNRNSGAMNDKLSITLAALEHRYYGESYPKFSQENNDKNIVSESPVTNENLVYLNSRQAAADLAHFIHTTFLVSPQKSFPTARDDDDSTIPIVILFGGSYPGVLAAFARSLYPHIVSAAVSSSAPVQAVLDFSAYHTHVGQVLNDTDPRCFNLVSTGHEMIKEQLTQYTATRSSSDGEAVARLARQFHLCNATALTSNVRNQQLWLGDGVLYFGTQENDPSCQDSPYCNIPKKCEALTARYEYEMEQDENATIASATVAALAFLATYPSSIGMPEDCVELDWEGTIQFIADPLRGQEDGLRSWLWQTCTEFGFYQTCERSGCPFAVGFHPLEQDLEVCERAFGVDALTVAKAVQATNEWSGGWRMDATRILSVTGTIDPWSEMAMQNPSRHYNVTALPVVYQVPGASHHFWTHPIRDTDGSAIEAARVLIFDTVHAWLFPASVLTDQTEFSLRGTQRYNTQNVKI